MEKFATISGVILIVFLYFNSCKKAVSPVVSTTGATEISYTHVNCGGEVLNDGGSSVISKGICWSTIAGTSTSDNITIETNDWSTFTSTIHQLLPNTTYYARAYATNSAGTGYGNEISFMTKEVKVPSIGTSSPTEVTESSAKSGGTILDENGAEILARGVCWSTLPNPEITNNTITSGGGNGAFESILSGLEGSTNYFIRAYATNRMGTGYGNEISFKTNPPLPPVVSTSQYSFLKKYSFRMGGTLIKTGGAAIISCGVCWDTLPNPTNSNNRTTETSTSGQFSSYVTNLVPNTIYYVRAYATNIAGTSYGNEIKVTTYAELDIDGNGYYAVTLGTQTWMKENLKTTKYRNGDLIGTTSPPKKNIFYETDPKYQWAYNGDERNALIYGRLYTGFAITDSRELCPLGWHVPSDEEWSTLETWLVNNGFECNFCTTNTNLSGTKKLGKALSDTILWLKSEGIGDVGNTDFPEYRNKSGFSGLPAGIRYATGDFEILNIATIWASFSEDCAWVREISYRDNYIFRTSLQKISAFSVRCIKDIRYLDHPK
jgi:uncharacterized protein (TIGR02145 family)